MNRSRKLLSRSFSTSASDRLSISTPWALSFSSTSQFRSIRRSLRDGELLPPPRSGGVAPDGSSTCSVDEGGKVDVRAVVEVGGKGALRSPAIVKS